MSGFEVLGAVASSIALVQAVKGTLKAVDFLRQNSEMKKQCNNMKREIIMIECFIIQAQQQTGAQKLLGSAKHPLVSLATEELEDILKDLNEIVERYSHSRKAHDPKRFADKMKWFTEASKIKELCDRAQTIKSNLHMAITFRVSSMVDRGNMRQEVLFHRVTQQLNSYTHESFNNQKSLTGLPETNSTITYQPRIQELDDQEIETQEASPSGRSNHTTITTKEETFMTVTTVQPLGIRTCDLACHCRCHRNRRQYDGGAWANSILGSWLVRYGSSGSACKGRCGTNMGVKLEYRLPKWLWAGVVSFEACQGPRLSMSLRPRRVFGEPGEASIVFSMLKHPSTLQEYLREGYKYFPDDVDPSGTSLLQYSITHNCWSSVEILLELWKTILPYQGLPRLICYLFIREYNRYEEPPDTLDLILERLSSLIPGWDEERTTDIHLEAANPEGTADGMMKALKKESWAINEPDECGYSPIHLAVLWGNPEVIELLVMAGANINQLCGIGCTPFLCSPAGVRMLLEAGAMTKLPKTPIFVSPVMLALGSDTDQESVDEIADLLLMHGADLEERDENGMAPITTAIMGRNILALHKFVSAGASLTAMTLENYNILHIAASVADVEILDYIAKLDLTDVRVTQRSTRGTNPLEVLHSACIRPPWRVNKYRPRLSSAEIEAFITFYFDLLIPEMRRHMSTIDELLRAVEDKDASTATRILDQLVKKNVKCGEPDLVGWYRGLKGYVFGGDWDHLAGVLKEEYDETGEKIERAKIARGKTITDPEMEEFF
ncbi:unnamed protein product [Fusarium equiseti]|uniref:Fungal N-terminal domain-containing protein n=1 Tax=Fusarium equiseti TaxID=61235 RepID=A0A8J2N915_FUSEQ|nr:unnamed protein product [Fusarium equiseti]